MIDSGCYLCYDRRNFFESDFWKRGFCMMTFAIVNLALLSTIGGLLIIANSAESCA